MPRRFPIPWTIEEMPAGYAVNDAAGEPIVRIYADEGPRSSMSHATMTRDEARRIATAISRLPELLAREKAV
jgi:hypothetical protein